jgi:hypothetical protein
MAIGSVIGDMRHLSEGNGGTIGDYGGLLLRPGSDARASADTNPTIVSLSQSGLQWKPNLYEDSRYVGCWPPNPSTSPATFS